VPTASMWSPAGALRDVRREQVAGEQDRHRALEAGEQMNAFSRRWSLTGTRHSPTSTGRITKATTTPRVTPGIHTSGRTSSSRSTVNPNTTNATISARLASAEWNRSIPV